MPHSENGKEERLLTRKQVSEVLGVSESSIERWCREREDFPLPRHLAGRSVRWLLSEVHQFLATLPVASAYDFDSDRRNGRR
ncbi:AlpA family phage regulatory protein [Meridianimarinicoccus roseus]|uniref:AlpA family phage regulatory protein n=1 Tax=Meridianimarinicoccus roseus TaxID=2072018 RepID=A0A2V2LFW0_9RHOB|nr:AlpA family phage regulatory protein [Meridianimarinicoccus roseus]PWR01299.1 AlpA family phage regulatory protein [Meridianimarinicoccus roseus]